MLPRRSLSGGECTTVPDKSVTYPKLYSKRPLYGVIVVAREGAKPGSVQEFHFVLDMSEAEAKAEEQRPAKAAEKTADETGKAAEKAADKTSKAGEKGVNTPAPNLPRPLPYDRLIIDLNGGLDLTQAPVIGLMKSAPAGPAMNKDARAFGPITLSLGGDAGAASLPLRLLLKFTPVGDKMTCLPILLLREGEIKLGQKVYTATLVPSVRMASSSPATQLQKKPGQPSQQAGKAKWVNVVGGFDQPITPLLLTSAGHVLGPPSYYSPDQLKTIREADGEYYQLLASPAGDQLTVRPYPGERGVFAVGKGSRNLKDSELSVTGLFVRPRSDKKPANAAVPAGEMFPLGDLLPPVPIDGEKEEKRVKLTKFRLPEGAYEPLLLDVNFGKLEFRLQKDNAAKQVNKEPRAISIRKDKPFVSGFLRQARGDSA